MGKSASKVPRLSLPPGIDARPDKARSSAKPNTTIGFWLPQKAQMGWEKAPDYPVEIREKLEALRQPFESASYWQEESKFWQSLGELDLAAYSKFLAEQWSLFKAPADVRIGGLRLLVSTVVHSVCKQQRALAEANLLHPVSCLVL